MKEDVARCTGKRKWSHEPTQLWLCPLRFDCLRYTEKAHGDYQTWVEPPDAALSNDCPIIIKTERGKHETRNKK